MSRAPLDRVSNDLFHPPPAVSFGFHFPRVGFVVHLGIEISFAFEPLSKIFLSFFEQVRVNRAFLINRYQFFQLSSGKLRAAHRQLHTRAFGDIQIERDCVLRGVIIAPAHCCARAQMPLLHQKLADSVGSALQPCGSDFAACFHLQSRKNFGVTVLRAVL